MDTGRTGCSESRAVAESDVLPISTCDRCKRPTGDWNGFRFAGGWRCADCMSASLGRVVSPPPPAPSFRIRTRCVSTIDADGFITDEYEDEILPAVGE